MHIQLCHWTAYNGTYFKIIYVTITVKLFQEFSHLQSCMVFVNLELNLLPWTNLRQTEKGKVFRDLDLDYLS